MSHEEHVRNIPMSDAERERLIVSIQTGRAVRWECKAANYCPFKQ